VKVEIGDWVRFRGGTRIYEVQGTVPRDNSPNTHFIEVNGSKLLHRVERVESVASKFWIKKADRK